jgi:ribonuclease D
VNPASHALKQPSQIHLIQRQDDFDRLVSRFSKEPLVAVDTEAASFHRFLDRVYLLQLSSRTETAVVDPLAVANLDHLGELLAAPAIEIVFHDADYDLRLLEKQYGFRANHLFDTRIAAQLLNEPGVGLAALLEKYLGVQLDKRFQRADWSARPLTPDMLEYAAADTRHLPALRDRLRDRLQELGRLEWAEEEFQIISEATRLVAEPDEPAFLRVKGAKALKGRSLAVLRELFQWREELARRTDKAAFRILNNEPLLAMAKSPPRDLAALGSVRGISPDQVQRRGKDILAAIQRALQLPESELPRVDRRPRYQPDAALDARLERLKTTRNTLAQRYGLAPGVLCANGVLEAIARVNPKTTEQLAEIRELRRWQVRELGGELLASLRPTSPGDQV